MNIKNNGGAMKNLIKKILVLLFCLLLIPNSQLVSAQEEPNEEIKEELNEDYVEMPSLSKSQILIYITGNMSEVKKLKGNDLNNFLLESSPTLILDNGNFSLKDEGTNHQFMDRISYDAVNLGSRELKKGKDFIDSLKESLWDKLINANIVDENGTNYFNPYILETINLPGGHEYKLGVIGLLTEEIETSRLTLKNPLESLKDTISNIEEESIDGLIVLIDGPINEDLKNYILENQLITAVTTTEETSLNSSLNKVYINLDKNKGNLHKLAIDIKENDEAIVSLEETSEPIDLESIDKKEEENNQEAPNNIYTFTNSIGIDAFNDSPLPDLFHSSNLSHFISETYDNSLPIVSMVNIFSLKNEIKEGEYTKEELTNLFPSKDKVLALTITGSDLMKIMENSFSIYDTTTALDKVRLNSDSGFTLMDFYDNIYFGIDTSKESGNKIVNLSWIEEDRQVNPDEQIILLLNEGKYTKLLNEGLINDTNEIIWESKTTMTKMLLNYISSYDGEALDISTNNNWTLMSSGMRSFSSSSFPNIENMRLIPHYLDKESPIVQYILKLMISEKETDFAVIDKNLITGEFPEGPISLEIIKSIISEEVKIGSTKILGKDLKELVEKDILNNSYQIEGLKIVKGIKEGKNVLIDLQDIHGNNIEDKNAYTIAITEKNPNSNEKTIQDILVDHIKLNPTIDFQMTENISEVGNIQTINTMNMLSSDTPTTNTPYVTKPPKTIPEKRQYTTKANDKKIVYDNNKENKTAIDKGKTLPSTGFFYSKAPIFLGIILLAFSIKLFFPNEIQKIFSKLKGKKNKL